MRNAYSGYTYQQHVTLLLLSIMDVERDISKIEIEAKTSDDFDDLILTTDSKRVQVQIKDFDDVTIESLKIRNSEIFIKGKAHKLSKSQNIIFFKKIDVPSDEKFLNLKSYRLNKNVSIVSLSRIQINEKIDSLYKGNAQRKNEIESFLHSNLDNRIWHVPIESLPQLKIFITELQEKSIIVSHKLLEFENILFIEGKPGVGKSHFVNTLIGEYPNNILYRFWIGNQDRDYQDRLKFENFIRDLNSKLFYDQKIRQAEDLLIKLKTENKTFIIDGLDHVENYNKQEFGSYVDFINRAKDYCKVIVLSRPLLNQPNWKKHILDNWSWTQTEKVLKTLFHISDYSTNRAIYDISQGYPIVVKYLAEHYKLNHLIPQIEQVENLDSYYQNIISDEKGKHSLSLFLCCSSYIMKSEIGLFIGEEKNYIEEFIQEHPYLFEIKLNRISLFHDSFNTFLRKQINFKHKSEKVAGIVARSILNSEKRFLSRFSSFQLSNDQKKKILKKYAFLQQFEMILENNIDFESVRAFYIQLREILIDFPTNILNVINYYDLSLIHNLIMREHLSTINTFYYTFVQSLIANGVTDEDITSSDYLFGMYYYVKTKNASILLNRTSRDHYDVEHFHKKLDWDIYKEEMHVKKHSKKLDKKAIDRLLKEKVRFRINVTHTIENIFIHNSKIKGYETLKSSFEEYVKGNTDEALYQLERFLSRYDEPLYHARWILKEVFDNLISYGHKIDKGKNENHELTLKELINKYSDLGSFNLSTKIHNYIRLAVLEHRQIDITSIYLYWTKFYQRKDYTLHSLPIALKTLKSEKLISLEDSIQLIIKVQNASEKGNRHLLTEFIELYKPSKIIPFLEENFDTKQLQVEWFNLPAKYINKISDGLYNSEQSDLLNYHSTLPIPFEEIENILNSKRFKELESFLHFFKAKIQYKADQVKLVEKFKSSKLNFEQVTDEPRHDQHKQNSEQRFNNGILTFRDKIFIKQNKLQPYQIANYSDGDYTSLPNIEIFEIYKPLQVTRQFRQILYNSLTSKTRGINFFLSLYHHPGNFLAMIKLYRNSKEFKAAVNSFVKFINLSMLKLKLDK